MTREFKVGDEVFNIEYGIGKVINITKCHVETSMDGVYNSYNLNGKKWNSDKRPSLYHLDEAVKLFPMWLEEVEETTTEVRIGAYSIRNGLMDPMVFQKEIKDKIQLGDDQIIVEIHIPTKRKIILEKSND